MTQLSLSQLWAGRLAPVPADDFPLKCRFCSKGFYRGCAQQQHEKHCPQQPASSAPAVPPGASRAHAALPDASTSSAPAALPDASTSSAPAALPSSTPRRTLVRFDSLEANRRRVRGAAPPKRKDKRKQNKGADKRQRYTPEQKLAQVVES